MDHVERFRALMHFQPVDRLPFIEWASWWDKTIERWHAEGLPRELTDRYDIVRYFGLDVYYQVRHSPRAATLPQPAYHGAGLIKDKEDYCAMLPHLYPPSTQALENLARWGEEQSRGEAVIWLTLEGFFWYPRTLFGIEQHLYSFYDQPDLLKRINEDLTEYYVRLLEEVKRICPPVFMTFAEDMSYNNGPMLSESLYNTFIAPYYDVLVPLLHDMGTLVIVDSDGDISKMIPWLTHCGIDGVLPLERQAGVDGNALRTIHPHWCMVGHYDKMVMNKGAKAIGAEFERLLPLARSGGFLPGVDHQTPPGVSLAEYREYLAQLWTFCTSAAPKGESLNA